MKNKILINRPQSLNEIGGRNNNEDSIYPAKDKATENDAVFLVCDGVGGANKGEVASGILSSGIPQYLFGLNTKRYTQDDIRNAIIFAEKKMDEYIGQHPGSNGMASTLTLLVVNPDNCLVVWAGDSRIYQIREGRIIFKSRDHSLVNHLIGTGEISEEEARTHPRKNMILKAVQGSENAVRADIKELTDVRKNDFFFMCTDGVMENITDDKISYLCSNNFSEKEIINFIIEQCEGKTKDNYSLYLVKVRENETPAQLQEQPKSKNKYSLIGLALFIFLVIAAWLFFRNHGQTDNSKLKETTAEPTNNTEKKNNADKTNTDIKPEIQNEKYKPDDLKDKNKKSDKSGKIQNNQKVTENKKDTVESIQKKEPEKNNVSTDPATEKQNEQPKENKPDSNAIKPAP